MEFEITHTTRYKYDQPAAEAYIEARLKPPELPTQTTLRHRISISPETRTSAYHDHFGNAVDFFSLPFRHTELVVTNHLIASTRTSHLPQEGLSLCVQEARQIFSSVLADVFDFVQPTEIVEIGSESVQWSKKYLKGDTPLGDGVKRLNDAIHEHFVYDSGATDNSTPISTIWKQRKGVCQDFAHIALSVIRTAGLPCRYVCGYIESEPPRATKRRGGRALVGTLATHAWVEVLVPGMKWAAIDPTNRQWCDERYVAVAFGRDFRDAAPLRGTFKGSGKQDMEVRVEMRRRENTT
jgi:transglutaminase-like putative cysteine protease